MSEIRNLLLNQYVLVRTYSAGVFVGTLVKCEGTEIEMKDTRRIWAWKGAMCLSDIAQDGVSKPLECKFSQEINQIILTNVIEISKVTLKAKQSIAAVPIWKE